MSLKIYNKETQKWETHASSMASSIKVLDVSNNYTSEVKNVETCLSELKNDIKETNKAIKYVFDHGGNGDGSGGGGSILPTLTVLGEKEYTVTTDQTITIEYSFTSNNRGNGIIQLTGGGKVEEKEIAQGKIYTWTVGPFTKGKHSLSLNVRDSQGFWSGAVGIIVNSGALQLIDYFDHDKSYLPGEIVEIPYTLETASPIPVNVIREFNGSSETVVQSAGDKVWNVQLPNVKGVYKASIKAVSDTLESNTISYSLIAADSKTLYMTSTFPTDPEVIQCKLNQNIVIDYTNSMLGHNYYNSYIYVDNMSENAYVSKVTSINGRNNAIIGDRLEIGEHRIRIKTVTLDGLYSAQLDFIVNISSSNFIPYPDVKDGLIAHFEATGNMNNSETRNIWRNRVENSNITCELFNYNYSSNGWMQVSKGRDLPTVGSLFDLKEDENATETVLRCSGKTYAVIDYAPFVNGIAKGKGFTFEIVYRTENTGDPDAKVVSCKNEPDDTKGFDIDTQYANIKTIYGEQTSVPFNENEWTRMSFVINRSKEKMYIYCNGILSGFANVKSVFGSSDGFRYDGKIILGASLNRTVIPGDEESGEGAKVIEEFANFSNCDIRTVRIYNRALDKTEILSNYISDIKNEEEQMIVRQVNGLEEGFEDTIPTVNIINADAIESSDTELPCVIDYTDKKNPDKTRLFQTCTIQWQGTSSLEYPVKNFTIKLREDGRDYYGWTPNDDWKPESRWTLKANYMDSSQSNNVGSAKFIHDFFKQNVYPIQREFEGVRTNIDGFPVVLMIGGKFRGIYTFNIDRYSYNNYGFSTYETNGTATKNPNVVSYEFNVNNSPVFELDYSTPEKELKAWNETVRFHLKHRYNGKTDTPTELITSGSETTEVLYNKDSHKELMDLLKWMASFKDTEADRARWADELEDHFSIPHLIDYFLIAYAFGMIDNLGKNMVLTSYGKTLDSEGNQLTIWYPNFYDGDSILGLDNVGANVISPGAEMATDYVTSESRLWKWLIEDPNLWDRIKRRYMELRSNVVNNKMQPLFSLENMMSYVGGHVSDTIGHKFYNEDFEYKYLDAVKESHRYMCQGSRRSYIERWLRERLIFLDSLFGFGDYEQKLLTMRSNVTGPVRLEIKTYSPQKTGILFQAGSEYIIKTTTKNDYTVFEFNLTNGENNEIKIKGANNIMEIKGLENLNLSVLKIADASRLTNVELPGNERMRELVVGQNKYLRILDVSKSKALGSNYPNGQVNTNRMIDLSKCENLRILRCNKTALEGVTFPEDGGVLDELDCSETNISMFKLKGQEYLKEINLSSCPKLAEVVISKCDGLTTLNIPKSALKTFTVAECQKLENVDISFTNQLTTFQIDQCPELKKLNMAGVSNNNIQTLNLSALLKLEDLDISSSSSIKHIVFGRNSDGSNYNKLKKFKCANSAITTIRYGLYDEIPNELDLAGLPLEQVSFDSCKNVREIRNIKLVTSNGSYAFNECTNLVKITGELTFSGSMNRTFQNCINLTTIPTGSTAGNRLDLTGVTDMSETFWKCKSINLNTAKAIMSKVSSSLTSSYRLFCGCTNIVTNDTTPLPSDFFSKCTKLKSISEIFNGCTGIAGGLHVDLFRPMVALENCYFAFSGTKITGGLNGAELPPTLFSANKSLKNLERMFNSTLIKLVPSNDLLAYNTELTSVYGMFSGCTEMIGEIPPTIFRNNSKLESIGPFFGGCSKVSGEIPRKIFDTKKGANNVIKNVEGFFNGTQITGTIPEYISSSDKGLFDYSPNLSWARSCFSGCSGLIGAIPVDLFKYNPALTRVDYLFSGCSGLGSTPEAQATIPPNLLKGKGSITNVAYLFNGCSNIRGTIPEGFLDDNSLITDISGMFKGCRELVGQIPARESIWVDVPIDPSRPELGTVKEEIVSKYGLFDKCSILSKASEVFSGCIGLNSFIPETLFITATQVTDLSYFFSECYYLQGGVPKNLFKNCTLLQNTEGMFRNCVSLKEPIIDLEDDRYRYAIPKDLFAKNPNISNVADMFRMDGSGRPHAPKLIGHVPANLFKSCGDRLRNIRGLFHACTEITGELESSTFVNNTELRNCYEAFGETKLTGLGSDLFKTCTKITDMRLAFDSCRQLTGSTFNYKNMTSVTQKARCFGYCTGLSNYAEAKADGWAD